MVAHRLTTVENCDRIYFFDKGKVIDEGKLDYLLKKSDEGNILCISSGAAHGYKAYWGAYSISKAGLEQMAMIWKAENEHNNVNICVINPGATRTKMRAKAMPGEDPNSIKSAKTTAEKIIKVLKSQKQKDTFKINL